MKAGLMINELKKMGSPEAEIRLHNRMGRNVLSVRGYENGSIIVLEDASDVSMKSDLKAGSLISELEKTGTPDAEVKLHDKNGRNVLFVLGYENNDDVIVLEDASDVDMKTELKAEFEAAASDKKKAYARMLDSGITLDDVREYAPDYYGEMAAFSREYVRR